MGTVLLIALLGVYLFLGRASIQDGNSVLETLRFLGIFTVIITIIGGLLYLSKEEYVVVDTIFSIIGIIIGVAAVITIIVGIVQWFISKAEALGDILGTIFVIAIIIAFILIVISTNYKGESRANPGDMNTPMRETRF